MLSLAAIKEATAAQAGLPVTALLGAQRVRSVAWPRQRAMYLCRRLRPDCSYPRIGREFGHRDWTTVRHAVECVSLRLADDPDERAQVEAILAALAPIADVADQLHLVAGEISRTEAHLGNLRAAQRALLQLQSELRP